MGKNESSQSFSETENAGIEFLRVDFDESYQQMRHYEEGFINICKFAFFAYSSITATALGLYKFGIEKKIDLSGIAGLIVIIGLIVGLILFWIIVRNRVYFVQAAHYINEIRKTFLEHKPMGFENKSQMYTDYRKPPFYNLYSSQIWFCHMIAFLNTILLGTSMYMYVADTCTKALIIEVACVLFLGIQVICAVLYWKSYDKRALQKKV
jgi:hypothetical protein